MSSTRCGTKASPTIASSSAAGVPTVGRCVAGTPHGGDGMFPDVTPEVCAATLDAIHAFAHSL